MLLVGWFGCLFVLSLLESMSTVAIAALVSSGEAGTGQNKPCMLPCAEVSQPHVYTGLYMLNTCWFYRL